MKFKNLTKEQIKKITEIYTSKDISWDEKEAALSEYTGKSSRTARLWAGKLGITRPVDIIPEQYLQAQSRVFDNARKRFIVSWCQNNTPIHNGFLKNIEAYAKYIDADIHIIAGRYKNPTSIWTNEQESNEFWDGKVVKYLDANRHDIHKYLSIMSDIKIQPTGVNPMVGMQALSGVNSCIFGSPKVQMEMIPVLEGDKPKMMVTTGSISKKNYTDSKNGHISDFHHTFGFCIVEIKDDETFYIRQVTADDKTGNFIDLYYNVKNGEIIKEKSIEAIVLGDLHYGHHDQDVLDSTMGLLKSLVPNHLICHDVFDGSSISHHEMNDPFAQYGKEINGSNDLGKEIDIMMDGLKAFEKFKNVVIVRSNHDDFLDRWLKGGRDWKQQPTFKNAPLYMEFSGMLLKQYASGNVKGVIPELINKRFPKFITLGRSESYKVKGFEVGQHGDFGTNGSRGSLLQFRKLNTKCIVGHYHSPQRKDGALAVGTCTKLRVGYNLGPSSWLQSSVIIGNDGRAQHINFIRDKNNKIGFTTFKY